MIDYKEYYCTLIYLDSEETLAKDLLETLLMVDLAVESLDLS